PNVTIIITAIKAAFDDVTTAVQEYNSITPPPVGALAKVDAALGIVVTDFNNFLASINIQNSSVATVVIGLAEVVLTTISGFIAALPAATAVPKLKASMLRSVT